MFCCVEIRSKYVGLANSILPLQLSGISLGWRAFSLIPNLRQQASEGLILLKWNDPNKRQQDAIG